jgi:pyruvate dehydrogenase E1 component
MEKTSNVTVMATKRSQTSTKRQASMGDALNYEILNRLTDRAFFMALQMIDIANHKRPEPPKGEPKVGGHPSACASSQHILAAIHLVLRNPEDYFACKPHVSPMDHALNFLMGNFREPDGSHMTLDRMKVAMKNLRHYSKEEPVFQSYHAEADPDSYRFFPSGSVGIPPVNALYTSLAYDFAKNHGFPVDESPTFWCLMGDSEFREGSLMEAMPDAGERQLGNLVWIVDYNRQNLDGTRVFNESAFNGTDADRIVRIAEANGWHAIKLKHGKKREKIFAMPGGEELRRTLDEKMTDFEFQALLEANRPELTRKILLEKSPDLKRLLANLADEELQAAFLNLGGHDIESLVEVFKTAKADTEKPSLIVAYTIKGWGLKCQAMSGNHSALPEAGELEELAEQWGLSISDPFAEVPEGTAEADYLSHRKEILVKGIDQTIAAVKERKQSWIRFAKEIKWPADLEISALKFNPVAHTQWMWGQVAAKMDRLARELEGNPNAKLSAADQEWAKVAKFFLTMAPDVGSSTNTSPNMNGKLYGDIGQEDFEKVYDTKDEKAPDVIPKISARSGHIRFEIAEGNCMSAAGSFGKFFHFVGIPLFPSMTIYDFFIKRALDQFYYNVYWHSSFCVLGTPAGVTLSSEGAQHSWKSDLQMPNCVTWEPFFSKELEWIMADMFRRHFTKDDTDREGTLIRCVTKGALQKDFTDRLKTQLRFKDKPDAENLETIRKELLSGGAYALVDYRGYDDYTPGDNVVHLFAMGALAAEALVASDSLRKKGVFANVFIVTSPDLCLGNYAYHDNFQHLKETLGVTGDLHLNPTRKGRLENSADWFEIQGARIPLVSVHDGEPGLLDNIGSIVGVKQKALAIRKTSKSGTTKDIYHLHGIDADAIVSAAQEILTETAAERFQINPTLLK